MDWNLLSSQRLLLHTPLVRPSNERATSESRAHRFSLPACSLRLSLSAVDSAVSLVDGEHLCSLVDSSVPELSAVDSQGPCESGRRLRKDGRRKSVELIPHLATQGPTHRCSSLRWNGRRRTGGRWKCHRLRHHPVETARPLPRMCVSLLPPPLLNSSADSECFRRSHQPSLRTRSRSRRASRRMARRHCRMVRLLFSLHASSRSLRLILVVLPFSLQASRLPHAVPPSYRIPLRPLAQDPGAPLLPERNLVAQGEAPSNRLLRLAHARWIHWMPSPRYESQDYSGSGVGRDKGLGTARWKVTIGRCVPWKRPLKLTLFRLFSSSHQRRFHYTLCARRALCRRRARAAFLDAQAGPSHLTSLSLDSD